MEFIIENEKLRIEYGEAQEMYNRCIEINKQCDELQKKYNFEIPKYILSEMIKADFSKTELCLLINMAVLNNKLTNDEADLIKYQYQIK